MADLKLWADVCLVHEILILEINVAFRPYGLRYFFYISSSVTVKIWEDTDWVWLNLPPLAQHFASPWLFSNYRSSNFSNCRGGLTSIAHVWNEVRQRENVICYQTTNVVWQGQTGNPSIYSSFFSGPLTTFLLYSEKSNKTGLLS